MSISQIEPLKAGDYITVTFYHRHPSDHSFRGHVLRVCAVESPFLAVQDVSHKAMGRFSLDLREFDVMRLSDAYVFALTDIKATDQPLEVVS